MSEQKITITCSQCGSDDIRKDAYAAWDVEGQKWELSSVHDKGDVCENCGGQCILVETPLESKPSPDGVCKYLDVSTSHVTEKTMDEIGNLRVMAYENEYGAWVYCTEDLEGCPPELARVIEKARAVGCAWVKLDCDGTQYDDLQAFDW